MPLSDYAHWNEDAEYMWWHEEGKHYDAPIEDDYDDYGYSAADAAAEAEAERHEEWLCTLNDEQLIELLCDADYRTKEEVWKLDILLNLNEVSALDLHRGRSYW